MIQKNGYEEIKKEVLELHDEFDKFIENNEIKEIISQTKDFIETIKKQIENIKKDNFTIMVAGEAKSGKSTFINAYLGKELLPMDAKQCTSSIIKIKYGEKYKLIVEYADGRKDTIEEEGEISKFLRENGAIKDEYRSIPVPTINGFLIEHKGNLEKGIIDNFIDKMQKNNINNLPKAEYNEKINIYINNYNKNNNWKKLIKKMEVEYPFESEALKGIEIIDSPGVNAAGGVGDISEEFIKEANSVMFLKPIVGTAIEAGSFKDFLEKNSSEKSKETLFLVLTRAGNANKEDIKNLKKQALDIYKNQIPETHIIEIDSKIQLFCNEVSKFENMDEIEEYVDNLEKTKIEDFMNIPRKIQTKDACINYLNDKSNFKKINESIEKFARKAQYFLLNAVLSKMNESCYKVFNLLNDDIRLRKIRIDKDNQINFSAEINDISSKIDEIMYKINTNLKEIKNRYHKSDGVISEEINKKKSKFKNEIYTFSENSIENLKNILNNMIEDIKNFQKKLQEDIKKDYDNELLKITNDKEILYDIFEPDIDFEEIKYKTESNSYTEENNNWLKSIWYWIIGKEKQYVYNKNTHIQNIKDDIIAKLDEIMDSLKENLQKFIIKLTKVYNEKLRENGNAYQKKLADLQKDEREINEIKDEVLKFKKIQNEVKILNDKISDKLKEVENYVK